MRPRAMHHRLFVVAIAGAVIVSGCGGVDEQVAELERELADATAEVEALRAERDELKAALEAAEAAQDADDTGDADTDRDPDQGDPEPEPSQEPEDGDPRPRAAMERSEEGLVDQLRMLLDFGELPDGWVPATTDWQPFDLPDAVMGTYAEPGLFAIDLARVLDGPMLGLDVWESTVRVLPGDDEDHATAAVLSWGFADDSVRGQDVRVELRLDEGAWIADDAQVRYHCLRGVTGNLCV